MSSIDIQNNIANLLKSHNKVQARVAIQYLSQHLDDAKDYPGFYDISYENYGEQIIQSSSLPRDKQEEIRQKWKISKNIQTQDRIIPNSREIVSLQESPIVKSSTQISSTSIIKKDDAYRNEDQMYTIPAKVLIQIMNEITTIKQDYNKRINELNSMIEKQQREYSKLLSEFHDQISIQKSNENKIQQIEKDFILQKNKQIEVNRKLNQKIDQIENDLYSLKNEIHSQNNSNSKNSLLELKIQNTINKNNELEVNLNSVREIADKCRLEIKQIAENLHNERNQSFVTKEKLKQVFEAEKAFYTRNYGWSRKNKRYLPMEKDYWWNYIELKSRITGKDMSFSIETQAPKALDDAINAI